jgi:hypothetical protein
MEERLLAFSYYNQIGRNTVLESISESLKYHTSYAVTEKSNREVTKIAKTIQPKRREKTFVSFATSR